MGASTEQTPSPTVGLKSALQLAAGQKDEERVLGVTLALHHAEDLTTDAEARKALLSTVDADFVIRLLQSSVPLQRIALALLRVLVSDEAAATQLCTCMVPIAESCARLASTEGEEEQAWGKVEFLLAVEVLRQTLQFLSLEQAESFIRPAVGIILELLMPKSRLEDLCTDPEVAVPVLSLVQELAHAGSGSDAAAVDWTCRMCLQRALRGTAAQVLALDLLAQQTEAGASSSSLDEALSEAIAAGPPAREVALRLAAATLSRLGLSFGQPDGRPLLGRLKPLLCWMSGELQLGLEGHASKENTCAACVALEAAIVAFGHESAALESCGNFEDVSDCLRQLHRSISNIHCFCNDLPAGAEVPPELPLIARVAAAWQLEDPRQFDTEFQKSLTVFARLPPSEFAVLLPCIHETHDWHLTPALGKVLEVALAALQDDAFENATEVFRQCALMLTEVALDAAAYLPDAPVPEVPASELLAAGKRAAQQQAEGALCANLPIPQMQQQLPRPLPAADPEHLGVRRLCTWSQALWSAGTRQAAPSDIRAELGVLCSALLVSVPPETVQRLGGGSLAQWQAAADALFASPAVDASTWRLATRLVGFALDRHLMLAQALATAAEGKAAKQLRPPVQPAGPGGAGEDADEDEWAPADAAARLAVEAYLKKLGPWRPPIHQAAPAKPAAAAAATAVAPEAEVLATEAASSKTAPEAVPEAVPETTSALDGMD